MQASDFNLPSPGTTVVQVLTELIVTFHAELHIPRLFYDYNSVYESCSLLAASLLKIFNNTNTCS